MTDSNLIPQDENTVPEGAFGIGSKKTDDFTENERLRNFGIKDIPKAIFDQLKSNSGAIVLPNQITEEVIEKAAKTQDEFLKPRSEEEETFFRATAAGIVDIPNEIKIGVEKQTTIKITGINKQKVGMVASKIKSFRPPEPYKGKGIREKGQYVLKKEGKKK